MPVNKCTWLIQSSGLHRSVQEDFPAYLNQMGISWKDFGVIPFTTTITNLENILTPDVEPLVIRSGTKMLRTLYDATNVSELNDNLSASQLLYSKVHLTQLRNGLFYDKDRFDQAGYGKMNLPLLNEGATVYGCAKDVQYLVFDEPKFIKPSSDGKAFNAGILSAGESVKQFIESQMHQEHAMDESIIVADCVNIISEFRFVVVEGEVISGSLYRIDGQLKSIRVPNENIVWKIATEYALLYQPADVFVMDIAFTKDKEYKIVEYNCWNCSGMYACDISEVIRVVSDFMENKNDF